MSYIVKCPLCERTKKVRNTAKSFRCCGTQIPVSDNVILIKSILKPKLRGVIGDKKKHTAPITKMIDVEVVN